MKTNTWTDTATQPPEPCVMVIGYSPNWIDAECNLEGTRECFLTDEGPYVTAAWDNEQDCFRTVHTSPPEKWMLPSTSIESKTPTSLSPANQAIEDIKAILRKYDLAGAVIVQAPNECAFVMEIAPSWSCARLEEHPDGTMLRIRSKLAEYDGDQAAQLASVQTTVGMIMTLRNQSARTVDSMDSVIAMLADHFPNILHAEQENSPGMGPFLRQVEAIMRAAGLPFDHTEGIWDACYTQGFPPGAAVETWRTLRGQ